MAAYFVFHNRIDDPGKMQEWYDSPAYRAVRPLRLAATEGFGVLVDGFSLQRP